MTILFIVAVFNYLDRNMLSVLQIPIKEELGLSDMQLGLLTGSAFALFYATCAVPIARLADRTRRATVLAVSLGIWGIATALTAGARSFPALAALRIGVAAGESGCIPTSHSIISDYYPRERRASALAFWSISAPVGTMLGLALAGWLNDTVGWRTAFLGAGIVSTLFAPLVFLFLKEPPRGRYDGNVSLEAPPLSTAISTLWKDKALRYVILAVTLHAYFLYTTANWSAPFYRRVHDMAVGELALWLALLSGIAGGLGTFAGGIVADWWARRTERSYALLPAIAGLIMIPAALAQFWAPQAAASLWIAIIPAFLVNIYLAPSISLAQSRVSPGMRAFVSATIVLIANLVGMGVGPVVTGAISDALSSQPAIGDQSLRYALTTVVIAELAAVALYFKAASHLRRGN